MACLLKRVVLFFLVGTFFVGQHSAAGDPVGDFFKRLGNSIARPRSSPPPRRNLQKSTNWKKPNAQERTDVPPASPTPTPTPKPMPVPLMVRSADGVPPSKRPRRDLPYGIPVPNKPGFVTSPYAPRAGYVDVRNFPGGAEVTDPYTGKTFLTP